MNPIKAIKANQRAKNMIMKLEKLKKDSMLEYEWAMLAACCDYRDGWGMPDREMAKKMYPELKTEKDILNAIEEMGPVVKAKWKKVFGIFPWTDKTIERMFPDENPTETNEKS